MAGTQFSTIILLTLLLLWSSLAQAESARMHVGDVKRVQAMAEAVYQQRARPLSVAAPVLYEDLLKTGARARLKATLMDGTELTLGENAEMHIDEFVYEPKGNEGVLSLRVVHGAFLFIGGGVENLAASKVQIETPIGILGVRGTTVWGGFIDDGYGVLVLDGSVTVETPAGTVTLNAGEATMVYELEEAPMSPHRWTEAKTARAVATISFAD